jgi:hypothetical protein
MCRPTRSMLVAALTLAASLIPIASANAIPTFTLSSVASASLAASSTTQTGRLTPGGAASSCGTQKSTPGLADSSAHHAYQINLNNNTTSSQCIYFTVDPKACTAASATPLAATAYRGGYITSQPATHYAGDIAAFPSAVASYSIDVPAGQAFTGVVLAKDPGADCPDLGFTVSSPKPVATVAPSLQAAAYPGGPLLTTNGSWPGTAGATYTYAWQRCDASGANCGALAGAANATFTPGPDDVGHTLRSAVTNTTSGQSSTALSAPSNVVQSVPPLPESHFVQKPSGDVLPASSLVAGSNAVDDWAFDLSLPFPVSIGGVTTTSLTATSNGVLLFGAASLNPTAYASQGLPVPDFTNALAVLWEDMDTNGAPERGIFTGVVGSAPHRTFVVDWQTRNHNGSNGPRHFQAQLHEDSPVVDLVYPTVGDASADSTIGFQANASGQQTTTFASSVGGSVIDGGHLALVPSAPSVAGSPAIGGTLVGTPASFFGAAPLGASSQWLRCDAAGNACTPVDGQTGTAYAPGAGDVGATLRFRSLASNAFGSLTLDSPPTAVVPAPPSPPAAPPVQVARDLTPPVLSGLSLKSRRLRRGTDAQLTLTVSERSTLTIAIQHKTKGHKSGKACVTKGHGKSCTITKTVATRTVKAAAGRQKVKVKLSRLTTGSYQLVVRATDAAGNHSTKAGTAAFTVVRR